MKIMFQRIVEDQHNDSFSGIENARKYAEEAAKSSKMRFRGFLQKLNSLNIKGSYLEVGAGSGTLATIIAQDNKEVDITAVEMSLDMVTVANEYLKKEKLESQIKFIKGDIEDEKLLGSLGKYDLVYSTFTLHHFENPEKAILNLLKLVKDDGVLLIYDLKRVWWLYWIPMQNGLFKSIRAAYRPGEIKEMLNDFGVERYEIRSPLPFFLQTITVWK